MELSIKKKQIISMVISTFLAVAFVSILSFSGQATDAFTVADTAFNNLLTKITGLAQVVLPVAIGIDVVALLLDHNEKRLGMEKTALFVMIGCFAILMLLNSNNGILTSTVSDLFN